MPRRRVSSATRSSLARLYTVIYRYVQSKSFGLTWSYGAHMSRLSIRIDFGDGSRLGPGKVQLLEFVDTCGSITASAKMMKMSYRRAWLLIDELNGMFETELVETRPGGRGGGNARLSVLGRAVVQNYRAVEKEALLISSPRVDKLEQRIRVPAGEAAVSRRKPAPQAE